jgi:hypothetical protein
MAHSHSHAEAGHGSGHGGRTRPAYDDINISVLVMVGLVSAIVTFLIIAAVQGLAYRMEDTFQKASNRDVRAAKEIRAAIAGQRALLDGGDLGAKVPINEAMDRVVERFAAGRPAAADHASTDSHPVDGAAPEEATPASAGGNGAGESHAAGAGDH